jgi:hypothetical protein
LAKGEGEGAEAPIDTFATPRPASELLAVGAKVQAAAAAAARLGINPIVTLEKQPRHMIGDMV